MTAVSFEEFRAAYLSLVARDGDCPECGPSQGGARFHVSERDGKLLAHCFASGCDVFGRIISSRAPGGRATRRSRVRPATRPVSDADRAGR